MRRHSFTGDFQEAERMRDMLRDGHAITLEEKVQLTTILARRGWSKASPDGEQWSKDGQTLSLREAAIKETEKAVIARRTQKG